MKKIGYVVLAYGAIVFFGGLMGCFIAHSIPSLIAGVVFGGLISLNAYKILKGNVKGLTLALIQSIILGSFFLYRLKMTGKMFPAAVMITISFLVAIVLLMAHPKEVPSKEKSTKE
ncbi:MAG: hypothetical protein S4CHLAM6_08030 [Chlamydiae bacterium]|nr:hypothetical protein [Chlamydiota bacterium]